MSQLLSVYNIEDFDISDDYVNASTPKIALSQINKNGYAYGYVCFCYPTDTNIIIGCIEISSGLYTEHTSLPSSVVSPVVSNVGVLATKFFFVGVDNYIYKVNIISKTHEIMSTLDFTAGEKYICNMSSSSDGTSLIVVLK